MLWWMVDDPVIMAMDDITSVSNASSYMMEGYQVPRAYFEDHAEGRYDLVLLDTRTTARAPSPHPVGLPGCVRSWGEVPFEIARGCGDAVATTRASPHQRLRMK